MIDTIQLLQRNGLVKEEKSFLFKGNASDKVQRKLGVSYIWGPFYGYL